MMKRLILATLIFALLGFAASASAQAINPSRATFSPSPDHAILTGYTIGYFGAAAVVPTQTANLGKPTPDAATNSITVAIDTTQLPAGGYTGRVKAVAVEGESTWSDPSDPFSVEPPMQPAGVTMTTAQKVQLTLTPTPAGTIPVGTLVTWFVEGQTPTNVLGSFAEASMGGGINGLSVWYLPVKSGTHIVHASINIDGAPYDAPITITVGAVRPTSVAITAGTPVAK
jgi:hypothetical protein